MQLVRRRSILAATISVLCAICVPTSNAGAADPLATGTPQAFPAELAAFPIARRAHTPTNGPAAASTIRRCKGYAIRGGRVTSMRTRGVTCNHGSNVIRKLYRGDNDGYNKRTGAVYVGLWSCESGTGLTSCRRRDDRNWTIDARYRLD